MIGILKGKGFPSENINSKVVPEGKHNEEFWQSEFQEAVLYLFKSSIKPNRFFKQASLVSKNRLQVDVNDGYYNIQFYNSEIVETTFVPSGEEIDEKSHAVVLQPSETTVQLTKNDSIVNFSLENFIVSINKSPFRISYWYKGKQIISEKNGYRKNNELETIQFNLTKEEVLFGGGARVLGMNRRGNRLQLYNKAHYGYETHSELMNFTLPIVLSSKQYIVHFDNAPIGFLDLDSKKDNTLAYETISGRKTYQIIVGDSWVDMIDNYTDLTGKQPMPPRWALGNFSSRFGYHSQKEVKATIDKFKEEKIPVDAVILDLYWFGKEMKGTMGNLEFYKDSFPNPKQMISNLKDQGVKTILITEPFVLTNSKRWDEAVKKDVLAKDSLGNPYKYDFYFGNTGLIDIYKPKGEKWFWNIYKKLADIGVAGVWGDLGEPEVHPFDLLHYTGTADEVHNIYGQDWARLVYEGYAKDFPEQRPFILMRAGYSGSQRYGLIPWSGDVNRTWGGLQSQTEIALQMGMQGLGYMHSDLGGFAGANLDDELYTRWLQYGVFQPIYRPHAQEEVPSEPIFRESITKALAKKSIELRYKLLPYNYNLTFENHSKGTPLMRPLFFEDSNETFFTNASTYFWGNDFLITPIVKSGVKEKEVHFPKNSVWFDFYTNTKVKGGQSIKVRTKENSIPTFVRAGAFIPMTKIVQTTDNYSLKNFDLHYYYDESKSENKRTFYNDDGQTKNAFDKGKFEILSFESERDKKCLEFAMEAELGTNFTSENKQFNLILHNVVNAPKKVMLKHKRVKYTYNKERKELSIPLNWNTSDKIELKVKFKNL
ncbi:UNVERIFIED_CONTAM: hypothetical protein GTU68_061929 [Idotea baltica]|nr:hypothetical protein [Idotea baltica]